MICRFHEKVFSIQSIDGLTKYDIDFGKSVWITTARLSPNKRKVAVVGSDDFTAIQGEPVSFRTPQKLWLMDLESSNKRIVSNQAADDLLWTRDGSTLIYSNGSQIITYDIPSGVTTEHFRFTRSAQGTNAISLSPDGTKTAYLYWKNGSKYIGYYDFNNRSGRTFSKTCFAYTWLDNNIILHDTNGLGLKLFDLSNQTSRQYLNNLTTLIPQLENLQIDPTWIKYLSQQPEPYFQAVDHPKYYQDRIFFVGRVSLPSKPVISGLFSIKRDKTDLQIHYQCFQCLIDGIESINNGQMIALYIRRLKDISKTQYEWIYIGEGSGQVQKGSIPISSDQTPAFGPYSYHTQEKP